MMINPFKMYSTIDYECGNERKVVNGAPDRCPQCGAEVEYE